MFEPKKAVAVMLDLMQDTETYENPEYFRGMLESLSYACGLGTDDGKELLHQAFINERAARTAYRSLAHLNDPHDENGNRLTPA